MTYNLFISHKHTDSQIARVVADFIETKSLGQVVAHVSSDPVYKGPRFGKNLNQELCRALLDTQVLILIYTSADEDWSYCMFECGVATDPQSPRTNIIVFQCGREAPKPFEDQLRVDVRRLDDVRKFSKAFFKDPTFFPDATTALAPTFSDSQCDRAARELFDALVAPGLLPAFDEQPPEDVAAWPLLRLQVAAGSVDAVSSAGQAQSLVDCEKMLLEEAVIIDSDNRAPLLFGIQSLSPNMRFGSLVKTFTRQSPEPKAAWLCSCIAQVLSVAERRLADIRWASFRECDGDRYYTPIVSRMRRLPSAGKVQFDLHFFDLSNPRSIAVTSRMIDLPNVYRKCLDDVTYNIKLADLRNEMAKLDKERLPILADDGRPLFMVHRSILERYLLDQQLGGKNLDDLTVRHLLDDTCGRSFAAAFATVSASASLADAQQAMVGNIRDVFVTDDGTRNTPVLGWLTNVDLTRSL